MQDVIGGQIEMLFSTLLQSHAHIAAGKLRALAVTTEARSPASEIAKWRKVTAEANIKVE